MSAHTRLTVLVDNQAAAGLASEHGLAIWIEAGGEHVLFDTGQGAALASNAPRLGFDPAAVRALVLSHGHYDHAGGIPWILAQAPKLDVYCHPSAIRRRYSVQNGSARPIHMPRSARLAIQQFAAARLHSVTGPITLSARISLTGPIPRLTDYEDTGGPFYLDTAGLQADPLEDELALVVDTDQGWVVCLGCAHAGLINTLNHVLRIGGRARVHAVIGGFHLVHAHGARLERTAEALRMLAPDLVVACHCTGEPAVRALHAALGARVVPGQAGAVYIF